MDIMSSKGGLNEHGTGDMKEIAEKAEGGLPILDPDYGLKPTTHEDTIKSSQVFYRLNKISTKQNQT